MKKLTEVRKILGILWYLSLSILVFILAIQIQANKYGEKYSTVIEWLTSNILPTISIITTAWVADFVKKTDEEKEISQFQYRVVLLFSFSYLFLLFFPVLFSPFFESESTPLQLLEKMKLFLIPFQGLLDAFITFVFIVKNEDGEKV
jgi:cytochrome bd-type quinol oxidase subunit 2